MESLEQVVNWLFGGTVSLDKITSIAVCVFAVIKTITEWISKKKLLKADLQETITQKEIKLAREENAKLKQSISLLSDIVLTAYLSSNTIPAETKKEIGKIGSALNSLAEIPIAETTNKLIEVVTQVIPNNDLLAHKEELEESAKLAEEIIDGANEITQSAIDKIKL